MTDEEYATAVAAVNQGNVVRHNGRSASSLAQLNLIRDLPAPTNLGGTPPGVQANPISHLITQDEARRLTVHNASLQEGLETASRAAADANQFAQRAADRIAEVEKALEDAGDPIGSASKIAEMENRLIELESENALLKAAAAEKDGEPISASAAAETEAVPEVAAVPDAKGKSGK